MRLTKNLRDDQENIRRFLAALGGAAVELGHTKKARPSFFIFAHSFISEYMEVFFKKEELLIQALADGGFPLEEGPIHLMRTDQKKCHAAADLMINSAKVWQGGDNKARTEVGWAASEYASVFREHLDRLKNLIFPLLEQTISEEDEYRILEGLTNIVFEGTMKNDTDKYIKIIESLEDELSDWK
jgi:hemerythrin-like domain-containing protein